MIRSRKLWCAVDPRGRLMVSTLAETRAAAVDNVCAGWKRMPDEDFHTRGYRVIRVRVVEDNFIHAVAAKGLRKAI